MAQPQLPHLQQRQSAHLQSTHGQVAGDFDSAAPGTVLVEALAGAIAVRMRGRSGRRLDLAEQLWKQFGTY